MMLYHGSRLATYGLLGMIAGTVGQIAFAAGLRGWLSIACGAILVALAFGHFSRVAAFAAARLSGLVLPLGRGAMDLAGNRPHRTAAAAGVLNGLLPCGLTYAALAGAVATGRPVRAVAFMVAFGAGTLPVLSVIWLAGISPQRPLLALTNQRWLKPAAFVLIGLLLIGRGWVALGDGSHLH
jgi:sulfite exporter TauE/SafE